MDKDEQRIISNAYIKNLHVDGCKIRCGLGWEKALTHFVDDLIALGGHPSRMCAINGVLVVEFVDGNHKNQSPAVINAVTRMQAHIASRCEFCWLGGPSVAVGGRCDRHRDWLI